MALLTETQQAQRGRKILTFVIAAMMSPFLMGQLVGLFFVFVVFVSIISKSANVIFDLLILLASVVVHLGILYFITSSDNFRFEPVELWIAGAIQFIPNYIFLRIFTTRGLLFQEQA